jgi:hypothetical protein
MASLAAHHRSKQKSKYVFFKDPEKKEPTFSPDVYKKQISGVRLDPGFLNRPTDPSGRIADVIITAKSNPLIAGKIIIGNVRCPAWTNGWADDQPDTSNGRSPRRCKGNSSMHCGDIPLGDYRGRLENAPKKWVYPFAVHLMPRFHIKRDGLYIHSHGYTSLPPAQWTAYRSSGCAVVPPHCMEALTQLSRARGKAGINIQVKNEGLFAEEPSSESSQDYLRREFLKRGDDMLAKITSQANPAAAENFAKVLVDSFWGVEEPEDFSKVLTEIRDDETIDPAAKNQFLNYVESFAI